MTILGFCYFPSKIYKVVAKLLFKMTVSNKLSVSYSYVLSPVWRKDIGNFIFKERAKYILGVRDVQPAAQQKAG